MRLRNRILTTVGTLFGVAVLVFVMLRAIPGDQITAGLGTEAAALTPAQRQALEQYYGLDQSLFTQFFSWLGNMLTGNFGYSARQQQSVLDLTLHSLPVTIELAVLSIVLALLIGVPLGMLAASRTNSARDALGQVVSLAGLSVPAFLLATTLLSVFAASFGFNPNGQGFATLADDPLLNLRQMLLPALVLGFGIAAPILRTTRTAVLEVRSEDFVRTARAKGVPERRLQVRHVLGNALVPIVTMTGLQFGYLLGGAVVVEQIFSVPGIGRQVLLGIQQKEYAVVQSTVLVIALAFVLVNLLTDALYRVIDPRVRAS
ncbi:ABC transporter permease subunit [Nonomuraea phyllanthi]|uniref:ABC transporter permease subunit n=1 Tax=Nonomuraea phyllanthi TaxID=2219224 RepID=A0A5C4WCJ2_9ACTN|nr:ABC transporter permease [Nonomuraea phyllanthi]KAB8193280.1 ABC transporter permease subunit [Nonomuraea phyllanthi]QFY10860.1 ABC transporter permease subunit [Nonomuraea phyllanthi]